MRKIKRSIKGLLASALLFSLAQAQTAHIGVADYGNFTNGHRQFIAKNVDAVVAGGDAIDCAALKSVNPDIKVFGYWGALFRYQGDTLGLSEDMYFHDPATLNRVQKNAPGTIFDGMWLMDPASDTWWRQYSIEAIKNILKAGFDGIHLDEVIGDLTNPIWSFRGYTQVPAWYDATAWNNAVKDYVAAIKTAINPKLLIFNGLNELPEFSEANYLAVCDGAIMEGFVYNTLWGGSPPTEAEWVARMDVYLSVPDSKLVACVTQGSKDDVDGRMFAFASYLLGVNDNRLFYYNFAPDYDSLSYYPEWRVDLGVPLQSFTTVAGYFNAADNVYERNFSAGKVLVNPSATRRYTVSLPGAMYSVVPTGGLIAELGGTGAISYPSVDSVTLGPQQGVILLNNPVVGVERPVEQTPRQFMLAQNFPNPFNPATTIEYGMPRRAHVNLTIYDMNGRETAVLVNETQAAGRHETRWNGLNRLGQAAGSGVYVMRLRAGDFVQSGKILMVR